MISKRSIFLITAIAVALFFIAIDLRNHLINGASFVVNDDILDKIKFYLNIPGFVIGFLFIMVIYQNIHNYNYYVIETVSIISSSLIYGWIASIIVIKFKNSSNKQ